MGKENIQKIIHRFEDLLQGDPWFGAAVYDMLNDFPQAIAYRKAAENAHSPIDILYHMITWTEFTVRRLEQRTDGEPGYSEKIDWRPIDPKVHTWKKGVAELKKLNKQITGFLKKKDDAFLEEPVKYRTYTFNYLLNGLADHHIYHIGQIALLKNIIK